MVQSLFFQYLAKWFPGIVLTVVETLNDLKAAQPYWHQRMLRAEFSVTGTWESLSAANTQVMADVVAMDSELPLKSRDAIGRASGDIPKLGMEMKLNEKQLTNLQTLMAQIAGIQNPSLRQERERQLLARLYEDTPKVIRGVYERNEAMFLQALSTGVILVDDDKNVGTGVRVDFQYKTANKFGVTVLWNNATTAKPLTDMERVLDKATADGNVIQFIKLDKTAFNNMLKTTEFKERFAFSQGFTGSTIPTPLPAQARELLRELYGVSVEVIDRSVRYEKNGVQTAYKPWQDGMAVFLTTEQVGALVHAQLAEENTPVSGVTYQKANDMILVSKFATNRPSLAEFTQSQSRCVPVLSGVDAIYTLDSKTVQA